jgi:hypothetical protein
LATGCTAGAAGAAGAGAMAVAGSVAAAGAAVWSLLEAAGSGVAAAEDVTGAGAGAALDGDDLWPAWLGAEAACVVAATSHAVSDIAPAMVITIAIFLNKIPLRA